MISRNAKRWQDVEELLDAGIDVSTVNVQHLESLNDAIAERNNALALLVFVAVAVMVSAVVDLAARRTSQAARASAEAETLSTLAGDVLRGEAALPALLDRLRETFGITSAALLERGENDHRIEVREGSRSVPGPMAAAPDPSIEPKDGRRSWRVVAASGPDPCLRPEEGDIDLPIGDDLALVLRGRPLPAEDRRVLATFGVQARRSAD